MTAMRWLPATDRGWWETSHKIRQMSGFCWTVCVRSRRHAAVCDNSADVTANDGR